MSLVRILILVGAVAAGGLAFWLAMSAGGSTPDITAPVMSQGNDRGKFTRVLIAKRDIPQGAVLGEDKTDWVRWPADEVPEIYVTEAQEDFFSALGEMRARRAIYKNEPIFNENVVRHGDRGMMAAIMTPGMRAVTARLAEEQSSGGFILPGDRVDVFATDDGDAASEQAKLVLTNVRVLAIDQTAVIEEETTAIPGRTVTLEVRPGDVQPFLNARDSKRLTLVLRSVFDTHHPDRQGDDPGTVLVIRYGQG